MLSGSPCGRSSGGWQGIEGVEDSSARSAPLILLTGPAGRGVRIPTLIALVIAAAAVVNFGAEVKLKLGTGMTGFDSTWYHGPFAAGFFAEREHMGPALHRAAVPGLVLPGELRIAPCGRDERVRPGPALAAAQPRLVRGLPVRLLVHRAALPGRAVVLALGAIALSVPALSDQAGEARNDIVGIFFLLAAVAIALNAWAGGARRER